MEQENMQKPAVEVKESGKDYNKYLLPVSILIAGVMISGSVIYSTGLKNTASGAAANNNLTADKEALLEVKDDDIVLGDKNAPVTIITYSDPSCPFCGAAAGGNKEVVNYLKGRDPKWTPPIPSIISDYVKTGKARLVFRYFPGHGTGTEAMKMMLCANEQGKFWELHDLVFENQNLVENVAALKGFAGQLGVDSAKLDSCLAKNNYEEKMTNDMESGRQLGTSGTPDFYVNGMKIEGAQPFSVFKQVIDAILAK